MRSCFSACDDTSIATRGAPSSASSRCSVKASGVVKPCAVIAGGTP